MRLAYFEHSGEALVEISPHPSQQSRAARLIGPVGLLVTILANVAALAGFGLWNEPDQRGTLAIASISAVVWHVLAGGSIALVYLAGAVGVGRVVVWGVRRTTHSAFEDALAMQAALGLMAMLFVSHGIGSLGLLSGDGTAPRVIAWSIVGVGVVSLLDQIVRGSLRPERWKVLPAWSVFFGPVVGVLIVSASSPPGWLWESEHGAYDVRSYHLQLAREWAIGPRVGVTDHNVYGALPSSMESAYAHLGQLMPGGSSSINERVIGGDGEWVIACQMLHAGVGLLAGVLCVAVTIRAMRNIGLGGKPEAAIASTSGLLLLATPWTVVCASLAYNEAAVLALGVGAMLTALQRGISPFARGVLVGLLIGGATCAKPTALLLLTPLATLMLVYSIGITRAKDLAVSLAAAAVAGCLVLAPWLARNIVDTGNPLFPFASSVFGTGHFTPEQVARHGANHRFVGGLVDRAGAMFGSERGLLHPQFGVSVFLALASGAIALASSRAHRLGATLIAGLIAGLVMWGAFTHIQSRFLVPLLAPAAVLVGLGLAGLRSLGKFSEASRDGGECPRRERATSVLCACVSFGAAAMCVLAFIRERGGQPTRLIPGGVGMLTGMIFDEQLDQLSPNERAAAVEAIDDPVRYVNLVLRPQDSQGVHVYLLGDAAPLYYIGATGGTRERLAPVVYHTTWDRSLFGDAVALGASPEAWTDDLRSRGLTHVLIDFDEIKRLCSTDKYYDPRVTVEHVQRWAQFAQSRGMLLKQWVRTDAGGSVVGGQALYELSAGAKALRPGSVR